MYTIFPSKEESFTRWRERDEGMLVKKSLSLVGEKEMEACWVHDTQSSIKNQKNEMVNR